MSAEDTLQAEQFGHGWTPEQQANMASLARGNAASKAHRARVGETDTTRFGRISDTASVQSPSNW